jgi:hypothetical protein
VCGSSSPSLTYLLLFSSSVGSRRCHRPATAKPTTATMPAPPKLELVAVGGWKDGYFADRGPRLTCRLTHVPAGFSSVPITVRTQTRDNVCSLPLVVKQELQGNSMKNWQHVFTILATPGGASSGTLLLVKAKTRKNMEEWLAALNNPKKEARRCAACAAAPLSLGGRGPPACVAAHTRVVKAPLLLERAGWPSSLCDKGECAVALPVG